MQARRNRLADVHLPVHDNAINRRANDAPIQIRACGRHLRRSLRHRCTRRVTRCALLHHQLFGGEAALLQQQVTLIIRVRDRRLGLCLRERCLGLHDALLELRRINPRKNLASAHLAIEIRQHFHDRSGHRRADIRGDQRLQRTGRTHNARDRAAIDRGGAIGFRVAIAAEHIHADDEQKRCAAARNEQIATAQKSGSLVPDVLSFLLHIGEHHPSSHHWRGRASKPLLHIRASGAAG